MPPTWLAEGGVRAALRSINIARASTLDAGYTSVSDLLSAQWHNPSDILSVLLLLGPEVVQKAIAQQSGRIITPVAFSFGWVAYAVGALLSAFGDGLLMPETDMANTLVIGAESGHQRLSKNWVIGRLLRDLDDEHDHTKRGDQIGAADSPANAAHGSNKAEIKTSAQIHDEKPRTALRVSVFEFENKPALPHGVPKLDWVWYAGLVVIVIQLCISMIPWIIDGAWGTFLVTACGNVFALVEGSLPHWRTEKWSCPKTGGATVAITQGNGSHHVVVIKGAQGFGLNLEVLAIGTREARASVLTRLATITLALLWIVLLLTVAGLDEGTWYLFGIGLLGSAQNLLAAGKPRDPGAMGMHLNRVGTISGPTVAKVLKMTEIKHPFVGTSLIPVFFPGGLRAKGDDIEFWRTAKQKRSQEDAYGIIV